MNPYLKRLKRKQKQSKGYWHAPKQEKKLANRVGGYTVSGSGSGTKKGDVQKSNAVRIEAKCTSKKSFRVTAEMLEKIENAAIANNELPFIAIDFLNERGKVYNSCIVCPSYILDMIFNDCITNSDEVLTK